MSIDIHILYMAKRPVALWSVQCLWLALAVHRPKPSGGYTLNHHVRVHVYCTVYQITYRIPLVTLAWLVRGMVVFVKLQSYVGVPVQTLSKAVWWVFLTCFLLAVQAWITCLWYSWCCLQRLVASLFFLEPQFIFVYHNVPTVRHHIYMYERCIVYC